MIPNNQPEPVRVAREAASALGRSTSEKGVDRLAAALGAALTADICEQEACERLAKLPGAVWVWACVSVGYSPQSTDPDKTPTFTATVDGKGGFSVRESSRVSLEDATTKACLGWQTAQRIAARKATIAERLERELAEADAAEAALKATAPLEFRADGSPADALPIMGQRVDAPIAAMMKKHNCSAESARDLLAEHDIDAHGNDIEEPERFDTSAD